MRKINVYFHNLFITLFCSIFIFNSTFSMKRTSDHDMLELWPPEIHGNIITIIFSLCLQELETAHNKSDRFDKIMYWIERTRFDPVQKYIDFNAISKKGNTILHHATHAAIAFYHTTKYSTINAYKNSGIFNLMRYLLEHNANPDIQKKNGNTAFFTCIRELSNYDLNYDLEYNDEKTMLTELLELFLIAGANPNICSRKHNIVYILASKKHSKIVREIIKHTDIKKFMDNKTKRNETAAMRAAMFSNLEFLQILADAGADFTIKNAVQKTALDIAIHDLNYTSENDLIINFEHITNIIDLLNNSMNKK